MMDSPLNLAHQQARKADAMVKSSRLDEAIICHKRAAEFILEAMQLTSYKQALESLRLQHQHHLKQVEYLQERQQRVEAMQAQHTKLKKSFRTLGVQTDIQGPYMTSLQGADNSGQTRAENKSGSTKWDQSSSTSRSDPSVLSEDDSQYHTITESDSLMAYLIRRHQNPDGQDLLSFHSGVPVERVVFTKSQESSSQERRDLVAEIQNHNEDLTKHVQQLLKEVEDLKKENKLMKDKLDRIEDPKAFDANAIFNDMGDDELKLLELPPLEMPTFEFDIEELSQKETDGDRQTT